ncbi:hypothetical protein [Hyalangium gracile]|uniref:hypothetical protein n=1 Tax=Hyalangium gracile TaxID=394092 RepID=UPI001CCFB5C0|nr:hypothetical protein [Hyalangium gracile]
MRKPGWLKAQIDDAREEIRHWPQWLRQARGLETLDDNRPKQSQASSEEKISSEVPEGLKA